jgi:hypothetical protein
MANPKFLFNIRAAAAASITLSVLVLCAGCNTRSRSNSSDNADRSAETTDTSRVSAASTANTPDQQKPEQKSGEAKSVEPQVQSEIEKAEAEKRATLLADAQSALEETRAALAALDKGDTKAALAALSHATGKLDLVVTRDRRLALAPVGVDTVIYDLYATPDTVRAVVKRARGDLSDDRVQQARRELMYLASEADIHVAELPLGTYPAAIKAVVPLIDQGKIAEAKAALEAALNTVAIDTLVIPLPRVRAEALLTEAQQMASKPDRQQPDQQKVRNLLAAARNEVQLAEALGYGTKADYKPLYNEMDNLQKAAESGNAGNNLFDRLHQSLKRFKFSS